MSGLCFWTNDNNGNLFPVQVYVNGTYVGSLTRTYLSDKPRWGDGGTLVIKEPPGTYTIVGKWASGDEVGMPGTAVLTPSSPRTLWLFPASLEPTRIAAAPPPPAAPSAADTLGALSSFAQALGGVTGNKGVSQVGQLLSQAADIANGGTGNVASTTSGGGGGGGGGFPYNGRGAWTVQQLLVDVHGWPSSSPPQIAASDQRDTLIAAAAVAAWGAEAEAQHGSMQKAAQMAAMMHTDLKNAFGLLSAGARPGNTGNIISEIELQRLANTY
jgi:hypothetical protein